MHHICISLTCLHMLPSCLLRYTVLWQTIDSMFDDSILRTWYGGGTGNSLVDRKTKTERHCTSFCPAARCRMTLATRGPTAVVPETSPCCATAIGLMTSGLAGRPLTNASCLCCCTRVNYEGHSSASYVHDSTVAMTCSARQAFKG